MIRKAEIKDIPNILEMAHGFYNDAIYDKKLGYSEKDFSEYIRFLIGSEFTCVFLLENNSKIIGTVSGIISPWFMDKSDIIVTEQWVWVETEHRGNGSFVKLINELVSWGKGRGANKLSMVAIGSTTEKQVKSFYERMGFQYMETHFIKEI